MFKNYIKIALRNLFKHKLYSSINIMGLAVGMACCMLIIMYVMFESSYDGYHKNAGRMYRVWREFMNPDGATSLTLGPIAPKFAPLFRENFPEFEHVTQIIPDRGSLISRDNQFFNEPGFMWADEHFFDVFTSKWIDGDAVTALKEPNSVILTRSMANKYFGDQNPMGQSITYEREVAFKVTGIIEDTPLNSHFYFDFLASFVSLKNLAPSNFLETWGSNNFSTYVVLKNGESPDRMESKFPEFLDRHMPEQQGRKPSQYTRLHMQPVTDIHLFSHLNSEIGENSDITYIYILLAVALFVLLIACINYVNLATARSMRRAKEVGMRKVLGAQYAQLMRQFVGESLIMAFIAMAVAILLVELTLPFFNGFVNRSLELDYLNNLWSFLSLIAITAIVGILTGGYPAFFLAKSKTLLVLKNIKENSNPKSWLRSSLVILQFSISIILIISMGIVYNQLSYLHDKDMGFNKEQVVVLPSGQSMLTDLETFKNKLLQNTNIICVSAAKRIPSDRLLDAGGASIIKNGKVHAVDFRIASLNVDHDYIPTFEMKMAAGRNFQKQLASDSTKAFIINEKAAVMLGWTSPQDAVGQPFNYSDREGFIIGVVKDFHFESLHQEIAPIVMRISTSSLNKISIRIRPQDIPSTIGFLQSIWQEYRADYPFEYSFVDDRFDQLYRNEEKLGQVFGFFAGLSIFIACMGLLGLAAFMTELRTKEIGIRKVLGASVGNITAMISKEFMKFIVVASLIAWCISYFVMHRWLSLFAYHIEMNYFTFVLASMVALVIALSTVGFQAVKAATANPVEALKYE
ncbi:ABC transporter permease [bacterium]|nr:ABC transporter permease [bacterium]